MDDGTEWCPFARVSCENSEGIAYIESIPLSKRGLKSEHPLRFLLL